MAVYPSMQFKFYFPFLQVYTCDNMSACYRFAMRFLIIWFLDYNSVFICIFTVICFTVS